MFSSNTIFVAPPLWADFADKIKPAGALLLVPEMVHFADGEIAAQFSNHSLLRGRDVCIIQSVNPPVHNNLMQLLFIAHELKNAGAQSIKALIPYFGYARHDISKVADGRGTIYLMMQLLATAGFDEILTVEFHNPTIIPELAIPLHSISMIDLIADHIKKLLPSLHGVCLIAPDEGAQERVASIAHKLGVGFNVFIKERYSSDKTRVIGHEGVCSGTTAIIIDDIIDTGGTALNVCEALHKKGYKKIYGYFMHPVLSGDAIHKIEASAFSKIFVSQSIPMQKSVPKIEIFDIRELIHELLKT